MNALSALQRDFLYVVAGEEDMCGLEIKSAIEEYYRTKRSHRKFYPKLEELVEQGFIEAGQCDSRIQTYTLTQRGQELLKERQQWEDQQFTG
ncbi:helix-turn-helix transcriptional regulator [Halorubrum sp. FL23]|uniref:helix-turn-helix transcriptional regulator n=1 Tax=Halorubrum sp. FL23 TaxID=3458704 RepID=UPI0040344C9A